MVHSTACLDLVNIRNRSQVSVILTAFEQRNETVSLTQRLLACGKKFLLKKKKKKEFECSTDHTAFHSSCSLAHPSPSPG